MYLLAVAIKRESTNVGTPETSAISFEARPGITYSIPSVQSCCQVLHNLSLQVEASELCWMVTSKQFKEVKFNYSPYLISSNEVRPALNKFLPWILFPKFWATLYMELHFLDFIHIHHTLKRKKQTKKRYAECKT